MLAERFAGSRTVQWTNYLFAAGQMIGVFVERSDETVATRYFHLDHLGSVSVITEESGIGGGADTVDLIRDVAVLTNAAGGVVAA